jgi:hypothetical protein
MTGDTAVKGAEFVDALLSEGHDYESIKANFLALLAGRAVLAASKKLSAKPDAKIVSGRAHGSIVEAARTLRMTRNGFAKLFHGAESIAAR